MNEIGILCALFSSALIQNIASSKDPKHGKADGLTVSLPYDAARSHEGRTINLKTSQGRKQVFIPKGWMFCTIAPLKCYSTNQRKKSKYLQSNLSNKYSPLGPKETKFHTNSTGTSIIRTLSFVPSMSVIKRFNCNVFYPFYNCLVTMFKSVIKQSLITFDKWRYRTSVVYIGA